MFPFACSTAALICFDGENADENNEGDPPIPDPKPGKTFTQDDVNKIAADERRKAEAKFKAQMERAEANYQQLLENKNLTEQDRGRLEESLEDVRKQLRTKEQQLAQDKKTLEEQHAAAMREIESKAKTWESRYRDETISRAILDAASLHDAFRPEQIVRELRDNTYLKEDVDPATGKPNGRYKVMVDFNDHDPVTKEPIVTQRTPEDAVNRMKELPEKYGNLFKAGVASGLGGAQGTGSLTPGQDGVLTKDQMARLSPAEWARIRKEKPELLGFNKRRR